MQGMKQFVLISIGILILLLSIGTLGWSTVSLYLSFTTPKAGNEQEPSTGTELASLPTWIFFVSIAGFITAIGFIGASISPSVPNSQNEEDNLTSEEKTGEDVINNQNVYEDENVRGSGVAEVVQYDRQSYQEV
eukprot:gene9636-1840_t